MTTDNPTASGTPMSGPRIRPVQPTFWRLDGAIGWQLSPLSHDISYDAAAGGLRLGDQNATAILPTEPGGTFGGHTRPTGLAVGPDGRLFLADPQNNVILTYTPPAAAFFPLWAARPPMPDPDPYTLSAPRGVAVSRDGDLVVADTGHHRLIIFAWPMLVARHILDLGQGEPWDVAYDSAGRLYVADVFHQRVRRFDRLWREDAAYLGGAGGSLVPQHLAVDTQDRLLLLDVNQRRVAALDENGALLPAIDPPLHERRFPLPLRLENGNLSLPQDDRPNCPALPLPGLAVTRSGRLTGTNLMLLARPGSVAYPRLGRYLSHPLDSRIFNCAWHRLVLDVTVPEAATLTIRTYTAPAALDAGRIATLPPARWSAPLTVGPGDWPELLIQSPPGRYLWLNVEFRSNGAVTPLLRALTLYAPRQSSLSYLPPVFHEDAGDGRRRGSAGFLDRFLSYFDTVFHEIETQIAAFTGYLDPDGVPAGDFLAWLASWFDLTFLAEWSDAVRRAFLRQAIALYKQRGTLPGLQAVLRLHTGLLAPHPLIIEHFRLRDYAARREVAGPPGPYYLAGAPLDPPANEIAHHFTLALPQKAAADSAALQTLQRLIEAQKPAHTRYQIRLVAPGIAIGCQSTIGVDMLLGSAPPSPLGDLSLTPGSYLGPDTPARPRLGASYLTGNNH